MERVFFLLKKLSIQSDNGQDCIEEKPEKYKEKQVIKLVVFLSEKGDGKE